MKYVALNTFSVETYPVAWLIPLNPKINCFRLWCFEMAYLFRIWLSLLLCFAQFASTINAQNQTVQNTGPSKPSSTIAKSEIIEPSTVPPPSSPDPASPLNDDFFKPPAGFEKTAPGTILRYRKVPNPIRFLPSLPPLKPMGAWQ